MAKPFNWKKLEMMATVPYRTLDSGQRKQYESGMQRDTDQGKPRYDLLWEPMLTRWAELMARGAVKYGENNWQKANSEAELIRAKASAFRHFMQWMRGDIDEDHAVAVFFNISTAEYIKGKLK